MTIRGILNTEGTLHVSKFQNFGILIGIYQNIWLIKLQ